MKPPTSVLVLAIIGIVLSILAFLFTIWAIVAQYITFGPPNPTLDARKHDPLYLAYFFTNTALSFLLNVLLLAASIACLRLSPWSRRGMLTFAWIDVVQTILGFTFTFSYIIPKMVHAITPGPSATGGLIAGIIVGNCGFIFAIAFPLCILYFFTRPIVTDAYNGIFPATPTPFPVLPPDSTPQDPTSPFP